MLSQKKERKRGEIFFKEEEFEENSHEKNYLRSRGVLKSSLLGRGAFWKS